MAPVRTAPERPVPVWARFHSLALLAAATAAAFVGVLRNGWVRFDDDIYVVGNPVVSRGFTWDGAVAFLHRPHGANWVPLTAWSHMLDVQLFGLEPAGHHATSLVLHVLNALLVALVLARMTGAWWRSLLVAAFFALHPLRVESVAWIAERKDVLSTCCLLLAIGAHARWTARPSAGRYTAVALAFAGGLLAKPMVVTLPFLLVVLDVWPLGRLRGGPQAAATPGTPPARTGAPLPGRMGVAAPPRSLAGLVTEKWLLFLMAAVATLVAYAVQQQSGALQANEWVPLWRRACNAALSFWRYVGMTVWPHDLTVFRPYPADAQPGLALAAAAAVLLATVAAVRGVHRAPWFSTGWLWYAGLLVPVSGLVQTGHQAYADRFTYAPGIGLAILGVWSAGAAAARWRSARTALILLAVSVLVVCGVATSRQVRVWRDTRTLFARVVEASDGNPLALKLGHRKIGLALLEAGETTAAVPHLERSLGLATGFEDSLRQALARRPGDAEARRTLAATLLRESRVEEGIREYETLLAADSSDVDALNNIAWVRATHVQAAHRNGTEAVRLATRARDLCPEPVAVVYSTLAAALAEAGRFEDAVRAGERAVSLARAAGSAEEAARYARQLDRYRAGRPFHFED